MKIFREINGMEVEFEELFTDKLHGFKKGYELNIQIMKRLIRIMEGGHK